MKKLNKDFLKKFKKNEIAIYVVALMLVTAGYFNYTSNIMGQEQKVQETYSESVANIVKEQEKNEIGDARLVNSNEVVKNEENNTEADETKEEIKQETTDKKEIETSSEAEDNYFTTTKLERDTNYASMISSYTKIMEDNNISETEKAIAMKEITKINDNKNAISVCENILSTKGFGNSVVLVNNESINVVVDNGDEKLTPDKVAQIQNIISREFKCEIKNIHITEK